MRAPRLGCWTRPPGSGAPLELCRNCIPKRTAGAGPLARGGPERHTCINLTWGSSNRITSSSLKSSGTPEGGMRHFPAYTCARAPVSTPGVQHSRLAATATAKRACTSLSPMFCAATLSTESSPVRGRSAIFANPAVSSSTCGSAMCARLLVFMLAEQGTQSSVREILPGVLPCCLPRSCEPSYRCSAQREGT